jgi:hypothetical protein
MTHEVSPARACLLSWHEVSATSGEMVMLKHLRAIVWVLLPVAVLQCASACATSRPRQRPVEGGPVQAGPGSLESVRKQLEGTWNLVSAEVLSATGTRKTIKASAVLTYDAYGNLSLKGAYDDPAATADQTATLNFTGRAVIDTQKQALRLLDLQESDGDFANLPAEMAARRLRAYSFQGDMLTLTVKDSKGNVTAVNTWRKQPK